MASKEQVDALVEVAATPIAYSDCWRYLSRAEFDQCIAYAFAEAAWQWRDQAAEIEGDGKRGSKAGSASLRAAAGYAADLATSIAPELASYLADRDNGLPVSEQIGEAHYKVFDLAGNKIDDVGKHLRDTEFKPGSMTLQLVPSGVLDDRQSITDYLSGKLDGPTIIQEAQRGARTATLGGDTDPVMWSSGDTSHVFRMEAAASGVSAVMPSMPTVVSAPPYSNNEAPATLTWSDLAMPVDGARRPGHRSVSQLEQYQQCGLKYRLSGYHDVPQTPAWWFIGGRALHAAIAQFEHGVAKGLRPEMTSVAAMITDTWTIHLNIEVMETIKLHPGVPMDTWQVGGKGKEDFAWWTTRGAEMLHAYISARCTGELAGFTHWPNREPLIETKFAARVGDLSVEGFVDLAGVMDGYATIIDHKAGSRVPEDDLQLKVYAIWLSEHAEDYLQHRVKVGYWMARKGELAGVKTIDVAAARQEVEYRFAAMDAAERAGIYMPQPSNFCKSCSVRSACPARKE